MSARIAPEPVSNVMAVAAEHWTRPLSAEPPVEAVASGTSSTEHETPAAPRAADVLPPLPAPPDPPGTMFAAAVMAGALSPRPETPQEIILRLGSAWTPPDSPLHLTDQVV